MEKLIRKLLNDVELILKNSALENNFNLKLSFIFKVIV